MSEYEQNERKMRVSVSGLGPDDLLLTGFTATDAVSRLFRYELEMVAETRHRIAFDQVLGRSVTVHLRLPDESAETHLNGLCVRFSQRDRDSTFTRYRAEIAPDVWRLTRSTKSRIFQRKTVPEILGQILEGIAVTWRLEGSYEPRDYCVQYRESDFDFASRLMEEEGISYHFEHTDGKHEMVVGDSPIAFRELAGESSFVYEELAGGVRADDRIWDWEKAQELRAGKVVLWDHTFELPHKHLEAESIILDTVKAGQETHKLRLPGTESMELYDWPGGYAQRFDGIGKTGGEQPAELQKVFSDNRRVAAIRMEQETVPALEVRAKSNVRHLVPGHTFHLRRHFAGADGQYLLLSVTQTASLAGDYRSGKGALTYGNSFTCMPAALPFRPPRVTPRPFVRGTQTAVVVGPPGEEVFTDRYGRVKLQFHWDREGHRDEDSSCWIRVGTLWAGKQWGAIHIPRIGQEVLVDFLEGDPDQPIVVGSVYNPETMPPYPLPEQKTRSGLRSHSSLRGGPANFNELRFEDKKGSEEILLHAERKLTTEVEWDESREVGGGRATTIVKDDRLVIREGNLAVTLQQGDQDVRVLEGDSSLFVPAGDYAIEVTSGLMKISARRVHIEAVEEFRVTCGQSSMSLGPGETKMKSGLIRLN